MTENTAITAGTILAASWGYEQTNVDFYEVTRATDKSLWLRPIRSMRSEALGDMSETVVPVPGDFTGPEMRRRRPIGGNGVPVDAVALALPWGGAPQYQSHDA